MAEKRNIADILADVAEHAERSHDDVTAMYRNERAPRDPSQVYSIRIPVSRLGKIRRLAAKYGIAPTAMLRQWILERLDAEERAAPAGARYDVRDVSATVGHIVPTAHSWEEAVSSKAIIVLAYNAHKSSAIRELFMSEFGSGPIEGHRRMADV